MDDRAETCRSIGNKLFNERDYTSALKFYREGLKLAIKHPKLNCNASAAAFNLGLIDESETYAVRAFTSQRNYEKAYFRAIKAAEKRNDWDRQLDYILKGMECCDTCGSLLEEAERIQHTMVLASFCRDSKVEDFFRQPKITQKVAQLDILMVKAKARKNNPSTPKPKTATATCDCRPVDEDSGFNPLSQSNSQTSAACDVPVNINVIPTPGKTSRPSVQIDPLREKDRENLVKPFRPPTTKPPTSAFPPKVATAAKDNIGSNVEVSRSSVQTPDKIFPPPVVSDMAKKNCEVPRDKSSQRAGKKTRTESGGSDCAKENEAKPNPASIAQEITTLFRNGREAFKNSLFLHAATYLTKARTLLRENSLEDLQEFVLCKVPLNYVICEAKVSCGEYTHIEDGIHSLRKLVEEEGSRKFPAAVYLLGVAFFKLNRFKEAREQLEEVDSLIKGNVNFNTYPWPGTFDVINATQKAYLKTETEYLLRQCSAYHKPDWICLFSECEEMSTHIIPSRKIYFNDPDFSGFLELLCSAKCALVFHRQCWKAYKERHAIRRLTDKAILGEPCLTPDCTDAVIIGITTFDKDGKVTHRDSIPYEPPANKL